MLQVAAPMKRWLSSLNKMSMAFGGYVLWVMTLALFAEKAQANTVQASTLGDIICNINHTSSGYGRILGATSFVAGVYVIVRGVLLFKKHSDNPADSQIAKGVAHFIAGGLMIGLPTTVMMMQRSVFGGLGTAGNFGCTAGPVAGATSLDVMMQNFVKNIHGPMFLLLSALAVIIGITMIFRALLRGAKTGADPRAANPKDIVFQLAFGAILVSLGTMLPDMLQTIFGSSAISNMSNFQGIQWSNLVGDANTTAADNTVKAILAFVQIVGGISFLRGWLILKTAIEGGGQATVPQGLTHIIGGAMAINIDMMLKIIDKTFGTGILKA